MFAVIFEVTPKRTGQEEYLALAAQLREFLVNRPGFISIERLRSMTEEGKLLSLSFWEDEAAIEAWRNFIDHRHAQEKGKSSLFSSYRIRVAEVVRDYTHQTRDEAPGDSNEFLQPA